MSEIPAHEIVVASTEEEIQQCYKIRIDVFTHEQGFPIETEIDYLDPIATHFLLRLTPSLTPVGVIRGSKSSETGSYKLSRLAVLKDYRQFKFGRELVEALHNWILKDARKSDQDARSVKVVCHSQIPVKGFYAKFGYISEGDEFDEDGDPHQKMVLELPLE
ncbi:acyl-CoA N-acyltransferase [Lentinula raphanica]|uniref:Acyl-CoA N-acyltransferase n=1 Tax=Lentinula raphanica TaxID=153919 RepID=A0AA38UI18_9AGAR|nr:acyl-CoA N-acyltransferase [Lentinula raphanica]KAJ3975249.1 acyl-CoA N-acyltransferase [Lentinula raphanica]